jgi:hypothetical protein
VLLAPPACRADTEAGRALSAEEFADDSAEIDEMHRAELIANPHDIFGLARS